MANWQDSEVRALLSIRGQKEISRQITGTTKDSVIYGVISRLLAERGVHRSQKQVLSKLKCLRRQYAAIHNLGKNTGEVRQVEWPYYDLCNTAFGDPALDGPVPPSSSSPGKRERSPENNGSPSSPPPTVKEEQVDPEYASNLNESSEAVQQAPRQPFTMSWRSNVCRVPPRKKKKTKMDKAAAAFSTVMDQLREIDAAMQAQEDARLQRFMEHERDLHKSLTSQLLAMQERISRDCRESQMALLDRLLSGHPGPSPQPAPKQTTESISTFPPVMEECGQKVLEPNQLRTVLHHQKQKNIQESDPLHTYDAFFSTSSPSSKSKSFRVITAQNNSNSSCSMRYGPILDGDNKREGQSNEIGEQEKAANESREEKQAPDQSREKEVAAVESNGEEEAAEETQNDEECIPEDHSEINNEVPDLEQKQQKTLSSVKHSDLHRSTSLRQHTSSLCSYSHSQLAGVPQHIEKEHLVKDPSSLTSDALGIDGVSREAETEECITALNNSLHTCNRCGKIFQKLSLLSRHIDTHTLPFCCNQCEKRYSCKWQLTKHQRVHTGERPFKCSHCGRGFMSTATLKLHVRIHTGERRYQCEICGKTSVQHLKRHMLMHKGEKNYLCTDCGKAFLSSGELRLHMRCHTGERPHTCKQCGRGFIAKCHLTVHMRSHTGERPYHCTQCPKSFSTSKMLKRHTLIHLNKKPFQCYMCGKGFVQANAMKVHIRTGKCK